MDYLDRGKAFRQRLTLGVGYVLVAIAIAIATVILVYQAYGYNLGTNGTVIQNGLIFFSSQPNPANIYVNGLSDGKTTNTRLILPSGIYQIKLTRSGYQDWSRRITVDGGTVEHFDYPVLLPSKLTSQIKQTYSAAPGLMTQSPDRRWLLIEKPGSISDFDLYDLKNPAQPVLTDLSLPSGLLSPATTNESWQLVGWADDNQHLILEHLFDGKSEFILVDRADPTQSVNLNNSLAINPANLTLNNEKYNTYYLFDSSSGDLDTATLGTPGETQLLDHVLAFQSYGNNTVLYVTNDGAPANKVLVKLRIGTNTYNIRDLPISSNYLVNLTTYNGVLFVAVGATSSNQVYIYQDPVSQLSNYPGQALDPSWVLHVNQLNYLSFSDNAQFIVTENNYHYAVFDVNNDLGYLYSDPAKPLDAPQLHASWMDGDRLVYVSGGKLMVQDYDNTNAHTLVNASSSYLPAFSSNYRYLYTLAPSTTVPGQYDLNLTPLLIPSDL